jgi:hypothetical protein
VEPRKFRQIFVSSAAGNCDRAQVPAQAVLLRSTVMRTLGDIPDPDDLAGLAWYYWLLVERVRSVNATAEEKQPLLTQIELWFTGARRRCLTSSGGGCRRS